MNQKNLYIYNSEDNPDTLVQEEVEVMDEIDVGLSSKVILFNDDWHTFDEVTNQIIKAIKCTESEAEALTWEVHTKGKAVVFDGEMGECLKVSSILEEIGLHTQIEY
jgi:ATP-dependent Clp protease adaptor protein ClpS